ncbi:MAG TPA: hypothetical protein VMF66_15355 [Candidatus Acidoferrum sp.]|nr:hypothetical protein [Candidatus Acidoferrum sp.]
MLRNLEVRQPTITLSTLVACQIAAVMLVITALGCVPARADCKKAPESQQCLGCANMVVQMPDAESGTTVQGTVEGPYSVPMSGALVEVFLLSKNSVPLWKPESRGERIRACFVQTDGKFSFQLKAGKYEMRFSKSNWNCTYQKVDVRKGFRAKPLRIRMSLGT